MDFYKEVDKRKVGCRVRLGELIGERYRLEREVESIQKRIAEIDKAIPQLDAVVAECERAQKDFNSYMAEREDAVTLDDIKSGVEAAREEAEKHKK